MNFALLIPIFSALIERLFPDKAKQIEANVELQKVINEAQAQQARSEADRIESQSKVIVAEASSQSYAARNWRPHLMYTLMLIVGYNFIAMPILKIFAVALPVIPLPSELWTLLSIGLGGYIGKDMVGHYSDAKFNDKKYFDTIKKLFPKGLTPQQVEVLNSAKDEALKGE